MANRRATPDEVRIRTSPREPVTDPTLGIDVPRGAAATTRHRLVTIGDSLTHGFMNAGVHRTDLSWPAIAAYELGLTAEQFTFPTYEWPTGPGGLPLDLERLARALEKRFGAHLDFWEIVSAGLWLRSYMDRIEDYWERGDGSRTPRGGAPFHNMAVYGWDLLDPQLLTATRVASRLARPTKDDPLSQLVERHQDRAAWPVLQRARKGNRGRTVLDAVADMSGPGQGVETLVVVLGSNNALGAVVSLEPAWTPEGYDDLPLEDRLAARVGCNLWRPSAFAADWSLLEAKLREVTAQHVIIATVPSVTIAPIARGTFKKVRPQSRYFPYYTRPWITDDDFDTKRDPHITGEEARAIDSAIDAYNETMIDSVAAPVATAWTGTCSTWGRSSTGSRPGATSTVRGHGRPGGPPTSCPARCGRWTRCPTPGSSGRGPSGRTDGGLFSLDGVHPTTTAYGILAQEVIRVMELAGVEFTDRHGQPRNGPVQVDFERLLRADTLIGAPPASVSNTLSLLGWLDDRLDLVNKFLPFVHSPL